MNDWTLAGTSCLIAALFLPAFESHGFLGFRANGWKLCALTFLLLAAGTAEFLREGKGRTIALVLVPVLLNLLTVALAVIGLAGARPAVYPLLGVLTLGCWVAVAGFLALRARGGFRAGAWAWSAAVIFLCVGAWR